MTSNFGGKTEEELITNPIKWFNEIKVALNLVKLDVEFRPASGKRHTNVM